jgi:GTP-binding protein Era
MTRCALVAIVGRPNVGKSTLLNALVGARVGIVSAKPNTTRLMVRGVQHLKDVQLVWLDTPGLATTPGSTRRGYSRTLQQQAESAMAEADVVVIVAEAAHALKGLADEQIWVQAAAHRKQAVVLVLSKVDKVKRKNDLLPLLTALNGWPLAAVVPLSALKSTAVVELAAAVAKLAPAGPHLFPAEMVTDQPLPERLAELTREQVMRLLQAEVPYGVMVETEAIIPPEGEAPLRVQQVIVVSKASHKAMVLGAGGQMLKRLGTQARHAMQQALGQGLRLELRVKHTPLRSKPKV